MIVVAEKLLTLLGIRISIWFKRKLIVLKGLAIALLYAAKTLHCKFFSKNSSLLPKMIDTNMTCI